MYEIIVDQAVKCGHMRKQANKLCFLDSSLRKKEYTETFLVVQILKNSCFHWKLACFSSSWKMKTFSHFPTGILSISTQKMALEVFDSHGFVELDELYRTT
jgi:hypothetical protein